jgi:hypothetical protein
MGLELPLRPTEADETRWHPGAGSRKHGKRREKVREVSPCCVVVV